MAPMTRARANNAELAPDEDTVTYYSQRAGAGLIVSEGLPISVEARGQVFTPGIHSAAQIAGWRAVTDAVHARGGVIFAQLWHVGRNGHSSLHPDGAPMVSCVATRAQGVVSYGYDEGGHVAPLPQSQPRALEESEIPRLVADYVAAAKAALAAGFDGVELHGANGYLLEQFISGWLNTRGDRYGGSSIARRLAFPLEVVDAIAAEIGGDRLAIRLSPFGRYNDMHGFDGEEETWLTLAGELGARSLAYVHLGDQATLGAEAMPAGFVDKFRAAYHGTLMLAGGFLDDNGQAALDAGRADLIAIGRPFIANPDLVDRLQRGWPVVEPDRDTFYRGGREGYITYPRYGEEVGCAPA